VISTISSPVDPNAPLVRHGFHLRLQLGVDPLSLAQGIVETHAAEDGAQRGARQLVDGNEVVADAEEGELRVDDLAEDGAHSR